MKELQVGDKIATGLNRYETVYAFAHYHPTRDTTFLRLQTSDSAELEITSEHLIYVEGKSNPVRASSVAVGDQLFPSGATVTKTSTVQKKGIYAPLTASGILLVNGGIQASNYASLIQDTDEYSYFQNGSPFLPQHDAIHLFLTPYRLACLSFATCDNAAYNEETGMPIFIDFGIRVLDWVNERSMHVQLILLGLAFPVFGLFWVLEKLLFGLGGFHLLFLCGVAVMVSKRSTKTKEL